MIYTSILPISFALLAAAAPVADKPETPSFAADAFPSRATAVPGSFDDKKDVSELRFSLWHLHSQNYKKRKKEDG